MECSIKISLQLMQPLQKYGIINCESMRPSNQSKGKCVIQLWFITTLHFQLLEALSNKHNSIGSAPASTALTYVRKSHSAAITHVQKIITYVRMWLKRKEWNKKENKGKLYSKTVVQALELLQLVIKHVLGQCNVEQ